MPCWMLLAEAAKGMLAEDTALGPVFSSQVWSITCVAMVCPRVRASLGINRWTMVGKKPSILEKWCGGIVGTAFFWVLVSWASSRATSSPITVTARAANLRRRGMVMIGVFTGVKLEVIRRPAIMLPHASRLIGLITAELFSLIGDKVLNRGKPIETKKITRRL